MKHMINHKMNLTEEELYNLIKSNKKESLEHLFNENMKQPFLPPVFHLALSDINYSFECTYYDSNDTLAKSFDQFHGDEDKITDHLILISLYNLARKVSPWTHKTDSQSTKDNLLIKEIESKKSDLSFLKGKIIPNDTWGTYIAFKKAVFPYPRYVRRLLKEIRNDFAFIYPPFLMTTEELFSSDSQCTKNTDIKEIKINRLYSEIRILNSNIKILMYLTIVLLIYLFFKS